MQRKYSLRKLSIGLASVAIGIGIVNGTGHSVKADTVKNTSTNVLVTPPRSDVNSTVTSQNIKEDPSQVQGVTSKQNKTPLHVESNNVRSGAPQGENEVKPESQNASINQNSTNSQSAEKSIVRASSLQEPDNQSNNHVEDNSQTQTSQKLDLTKNSKKLAKKVLATNLIATSSMTNGGFDEATWGKLDVNNWQGSVQDGLYQLTGYTGDPNHIIVPNEADFEKAGKSTNGLQVGIDGYTAYSLLSNQTQTIAFSKTKGEKVKAIGTDWSAAFSGDNPSLSKFDGSNLDVSNVTNMRYMFYGNSISDLTSLANWDVSNVTDMNNMFAYNNSISELTPLANWNVSNVTDMYRMFYHNSIGKLTPLANWNVSGVTNMDGMFYENKISDLTPLAHWNINNVTNMGYVFGSNSISKLTPLANWNVSGVTNMENMFYNNRINDLAPLAHWNTSNVTDMSFMFGQNYSISDLTPLTNWDVSNVTDMNWMFVGNSISDLTPLTNWKTSKVTNMSEMFDSNSISDLRPLTNWDVSNVTDMSVMFNNNSISNLTPLAHWNTGKVTDMSQMFAYNYDLRDLKPIANWNISGTRLFGYDTKLNLTNINNTPLMQGFLKTPDTLGHATFITNNADLVKTTTGKDLLDSTDTAKRTITFNIPHATPETITQIINYKAITTVQVNFDNKEIVQTYPVKDSDWYLDTSKQNDAIIVNGQVHFKSLKIPHVNGYKAHIVRNKLNPAMFMVSFMAVPSENKPSLPNEEKPSKPSAPADNTNNSAWSDLDHEVVDGLNADDSGWTMPENTSTYTIEVPADDVINLSDLVIAEPVHAQTRTQIHVNKHFKLSKKRVTKHIKHRKRVSKLFRKHYALL